MSPLAPRRVTAPCTLDIEVSADSVHAHVALDGVEVGPGDSVLVHGAPAHVPFGQKLQLRRTATVTRAGPLARLWTRAAARFELTELFEVSFSPGGLS